MNFATTFPASDVAVDASGNTYAIGVFQGTNVKFGTTSYSVADSTDIFVVKIGPAGAVIWARKIASNDSDRGNAVAVDAAGDVYIAGSFATTVTASASGDSFVVGLTP